MSNKNAVVSFTPSTDMVELADKAFSNAESALAVLNPSNVKTLFDAELFITAEHTFKDRLSLRGYKAIAIVHERKLWAEKLPDGSESPYKKFEDWANKHMGIKRTQAFNAVRASKFIKDDGTGSTLPHKGRDFSFSQLDAFAQLRELYSDDSKETFVPYGKIKPVLDGDGNQSAVLLDGVAVPLWEVTSETSTLLDALCTVGAVTGEMTIEACKEVIKRGGTFDKFGFHPNPETQKNNSGKTTETSKDNGGKTTETPKGEKAKETRATESKAGIPLVTLQFEQIEMGFVRTLLSHIANGKPDEGEYTADLKRVAKLLLKQLPTKA